MTSTERICPGEHSINKNDFGRYWLTCDDETIAATTFDARCDGPSDIEIWTRYVVDQHLIAYLRSEIERLETKRRVAT